MSELRNEMLDQVQPRRPLMCDGHNLCDLVAAQKLNNLTVAKLREICNSFDLRVDPPEAKRKAPFITALTTLVESCPCVKRWKFGFPASDTGRLSSCTGN